MQFTRTSLDSTVSFTDGSLDGAMYTSSSNDADYLIFEESTDITYHYEDLKSYS